MDNLFLLLFLVSLVCLVVGLIKPTAFSRFIKGDITRKKIGIIFGITAFVFFVIFGIVTDSSKQTQSNINGKAAEQKVETKQLGQEEQIKKTEVNTEAKSEAEEEKIKKEAEIAQKELKTSTMKGDLPKINFSGEVKPSIVSSGDKVVIKIDRKSVV